MAILSVIPGNPVLWAFLMRNLNLGIAKKVHCFSANVRNGNLGILMAYSKMGINMLEIGEKPGKHY